VTRKPTVEELGIDPDRQKWQRSGDEDGAIEVAFIPAAALSAGVTSAAGHAAGGPATSPGQPGPAGHTEWVLMRVAGDPAGRVLVYDRHEWECFLDGVRGGEFDEGAG
jgi:Domain of unknown function (DUF397)